MARLKLFRHGALGALLLVAACGLLDVNSPTVIDDEDLANPQGAELARAGAVRQLGLALGVSALVLNEGLFTDEFTNEITTPHAYQMLDRRDDNATSPAFSTLHNARNSATGAIRRIRAAGVTESYAGQMFAVRGFAEALLAQDFCPGFAFNDVLPDGTLVYGPALTSEQAFTDALADLDSAVALSADSARLLNLARVVRARVLVELGRFADAAAAAAPVPTNYVYTTDYADVLFNVTTARTTVGNLEGGVGLNFVSANDPRVRRLFRLKAPNGADLYSAEKYPATTTPVPVATGIEARLIEAEAALQTGDSTQWLAALNQLRATAITPAMAALADPGTPDGRVNLHFRERAFWLFATAHRLGDLRRLVRQYGRTVAQTFPTGTRTNGEGGTYGTATTMDFPVTEQQNPNVTGCLAR